MNREILFYISLPIILMIPATFLIAMIDFSGFDLEGDVTLLGKLFLFSVYLGSILITCLTTVGVISVIDKITGRKDNKKRKVIDE